MRFLFPLRPHITTKASNFHFHPNQTPTLFKALHRVSSFHHHPTHLLNLITRTNQTKILNNLVQIHAQLLLNDFLSSPIILTNLLNSYFKCGQLTLSLLLFSTAPSSSKNVVTWTSVISQLTHFLEPFKALSFFSQMRSNGVCPNEYTFSAVLPACADTWVVVNGGQVHCLVLKHGVACDLFVGSALVDMYSKCGNVVFAESVFDEMPDRNLICWNAMIVGYLHNEFFDRAIGLFRVLLQGVSECACPDEVSFSSVLSACANGVALACGRQVHGLVIKYGVLHLAYVNSSLMDMYCKRGMLDDAVTLFGMVGGRCLVAWNVMIAGSCLNGKLEEASSYFCAMMGDGVLPDEASYCSILQASASLATSVQGTAIHDHVIKSGFGNSVFVSASLIVMYSWSGRLVEAHRVFEETEDRNLICWSAIIAACQQHGCGDQAIGLFEEMLELQIKPGYDTYTSVISACSDSGRIGKGYRILNSMAEVHELTTSGHVQHYACMMELLGRAGQLNEAKEFIEAIMPIEPGLEVWRILLGACKNHDNLEVGEEVARRLFTLEPDNPENYMLLSDMYLHNGKLKQADEVRRIMWEKGLKKEPRCSWVEIRNSTFVFTAWDRSHPRTGEIYQMLEGLQDLVKNRGYKDETQFVISNNLEGCKENLRTCPDCHLVMKFGSEIL